MISLWDKFKSGLQRTKTLLLRSIKAVFSDERPWDASRYEELEAALIGADLGVAVSTRLVADLRDRYDRGLIRTSEDIVRVAQEDIIGVLTTEPRPLNFNPSGPTVILLAGVNGTGKTTTAGKLAYMWQRDGKTVLLAACDTFRAAAIEQLKIWGQRVNCPVVAGKHGADAAAVAYDAVTSALARHTDIVLIDTAGRQHTRTALMAELEKIKRIVGKVLPGAPHEVWLIVDGSSGSNALAQAREFGRTVAVTGLCLTKLDGTSKGGIVVAIHEELHTPVRFVGLGEGMEDLQPFDPAMFAAALFTE